MKSKLLQKKSYSLDRLDEVLDDQAGKHRRLVRALGSSTKPPNPALLAIDVQARFVKHSSQSGA
jgi:hypothetical protein